MKTDDLIAALALEPAAPLLRPGRIAVAVLGSIAICAAVFLILIGPRSDLAEALSNPLVAVKTVLPAILCIVALFSVLRLMRPEGAEVSGPRGIVWVTLAVGLLLYAVGFGTQARPLWFGDLSVMSVLGCLGLIIMISLPALALSFALVRRGASTAPARSGAALGLAVSAGTTAGYSLYCTQDNPIFFVTWYGIAMLCVTALGAIAGTRLLRW